MNGALAGMVILVIGDSHMMSLMTNLHDQLEGAGAVVHSYAMCGATAGDWVSRSVASCGTGEHHDKSPPMLDSKTRPTWNLTDLIAQHHPNLIVVELGDTMAGYGSAQPERGWISEQLGMMTGKIRASNLPCIWVGPIWGSDGPPYNKTVVRVKEMSQILSQSVSPCTYIDSTAFARPGEWATRDGSHLQPDGYRKWGKALADAIVRLKGQGVQ
jgi:hypothetical protein